MPQISSTQASSAKMAGDIRKRVLSRVIGCLLFVGLLFGGYLIARPLVSVQPLRNRVLQWINLNTSLFVTSQEDVRAYVQRNALATTGSATTTTAISGPLRRHPTNPRYFTDDSGQVVYLTGSHTWLNLQDGGLTNPPGAFDYATWLDFLEAHHHNFFRLWRWEETKWVVEWNAPYYFEPMPYERTGPGNALDGQPKFDLNHFDQAYFDRMRQRVIEAGQRNMYVSIMLFNGWSVSYPKGFYNLGNPWEGHPYNASNNINDINGDSNNDNSGSETHELTVAAVTVLQEAYVRKVIDTVNDLDNVLYEISNESDGNSQAWQYHMIDLVKEYEASKPKQHPVGMTVEWPNGDNQDLFASSADWISLNGPLDSPPVADGSKVIIADTDHLCGICGDRIWAWKSFIRGENPLFMDQYDDGYKLEGGGYDMNNPQDVSLRKNLGYTHNYANRINLALMTPRGDLASTGYALANQAATGAEYLVYLPEGGDVTVDLSATPGELNVEWFDPATGVATPGDATDGGASRSFTAPFGGDAVLYLYQQGQPPPPTYQLFVPIVGNGEVSVAPSGPYPEGQVVTLIANPAAGWSFSSWSGDFSGVNNPLTVTITANTTITATFTEVETPRENTVIVATVGEGIVLVTPDGPYATGEIVTLTALAAPTWTFTSWTGDVVGAANPLTFTISSNTLVTATFTLNSPEQYTVTRNVQGSGSIALSSQGPFTSGQVITVTAQPAPNWQFVDWNGDVVSTTNPIIYVVTGNAAITATFAPIDQPARYTITVGLNGQGEVEILPTGPYTAGQVVSLTALPAIDWHFVGWSGAINHTDNPYLLTISTTIQVTATFQPLAADKPYTINVSTQGGGTVSVEPPGPYAAGERVVLSATPSQNWRFAGWGGDLTGQENPLFVTVAKTLAIHANFLRAPLFLPLIQHP